MEVACIGNGWRFRLQFSVGTAMQIAGGRLKLTAGGDSDVGWWQRLLVKFQAADVYLKVEVEMEAAVIVLKAAGKCCRRRFRLQSSARI